jgi:diaminobutyrate-2-oxoglutarate transaminase
MHPKIDIRGRGLMWGIDVARAGGPEIAKAIGAACFRDGLIIERCGRDDTVMKVMPPLNIDTAVLAEGLDVLVSAVREALGATAQPIAHGGAA